MLFSYMPVFYVMSRKKGKNLQANFFPWWCEQIQIAWKHVSPSHSHLFWLTNVRMKNEFCKPSFKVLLKHLPTISSYLHSTFPLRWALKAFSVASLNQPVIHLYRYSLGALYLYSNCHPSIFNCLSRFGREGTSLFLITKGYTESFTGQR